MKRTIRMIVVLGMILAIVASTASAAVPDKARGPVTNLPMPRFVSLKSDRGNVRRGPSLDHRIDWVYKRRSLPLKIVAEHGHWRRIQDLDGQGGWIHYSLLSGTRTAMVRTETASLRRKPSEDSSVNARVHGGVVLGLEKCSLDWCLVQAGDYRGWMRKSDLWGIEADEVID